MKPNDAKLISGFLLQEFDRFVKFLDSQDIDPVEASMIIEDMSGKSGMIPTCIEQFSGFIGE